MTPPSTLLVAGPRSLAAELAALSPSNLVPQHIPLLAPAFAAPDSTLEDAVLHLFESSSVLFLSAFSIAPFADALAAPAGGNIAVAHLALSESGARLAASASLSRTLRDKLGAPPDIAAPGSDPLVLVRALAVSAPDGRVLVPLPECHGFAPPPAWEEALALLAPRAVQVACGALSLAAPVDTASALQLLADQRVGCIIATSVEYAAALVAALDVEAARYVSEQAMKGDLAVLAVGKTVGQMLQESLGLEEVHVLPGVDVAEEVVTFVAARERGHDAGDGGALGK